MQGIDLVCIRIDTYGVEMGATMGHVFSSDVWCVLDGPGKDWVVDHAHFLPLLLFLKVKIVLAHWQNIRKTMVNALL